MAKNTFGKSRPKETPYAIYSGYGPFGNTELRVLKTYQVRAKEDATLMLVGLQLLSLT